MEILRFIAWWWVGTNTSARILIALISWIIILGIAAYVLSLGFTAAFAFFFAGLGIAGIISLCFRIYKYISEKWRKYKKEKELEADKIVRRLRGG